MRIGLISREYPPETGWGGIGTFTHHLANGLSELGHDVHVVSLCGTGKPLSAANVASKPTIHRVAPRQMSAKLGFFNFCLPVTRPMIEETTSLWAKFLELHRQEPFDVVECPEHFAEGLMPALSRVVPLVIRLHTPHSKLVRERFHNFQPTFDHRVLSALERVAMLSADVLISPSVALARYVAKDLNLPLDRIQIIRNQVDEEIFNPVGNKAAPGKDLNLAPDVVKILFVGRLESRKGVHELVAAVPRILAAGIKFHLFVVGRDTATGTDNGSVLAELRSALKSSDCEGAVTFIDHVPLKELPAYYRAADLFVLPSLFDNAPMTAIEAMACGTPVVATAAGGTSEYVIHDDCGLIVPAGDTNALADALTKLSADADLRHLYGRNARNRVLEHFTIKKTAQESAKLYEHARSLYVERHVSLYPGEAEHLEEDLAELIASLESSLYDMTFTNSRTFRMKHRWRRLKTKLSGLLGSGRETSS